MADDFEIRGAEDFYALSKALKAAGRLELRRELNAEMRKAAKPLIAKTRAAALEKLPHRGGLAAQVAKEPQRVQVRTGQATAGVRIVVGRKKGGAQSANKGVIRHPVFARGGKEKVWVNQTVPSGWFDDTLQHWAPIIARPAVEAAMSNIVEKVVRGAH